MATLLVRAREIITCDTSEPQCGITFEGLGSVRRRGDPRRGWENHRDRARRRRCAKNAQGRGGDRPARLRRSSRASSTRTRIRSSRATASQILPRGCRGEKPSLGMLYTVERTREALLDPETILRGDVRPRLQTMLAHGTTTLETKTGYALHKPGEFALLDLIAQHRERSGYVPRLIATFLGAHALPPEFTRAGAYIDYLIDQVHSAQPQQHGARVRRRLLRAWILLAGSRRDAISRSRRLQVCGCACHCDEMAEGGAACDGGKLRGLRSMPSTTATSSMTQPCDAIVEARRRDRRLSGDDRVSRP